MKRRSRRILFRSAQAWLFAAGVALVSATAAQDRTVRLSAGQAFSDVTNLALSADGEHVVYRHDAETDQAFALWRVPARGGAAPTRLSAMLPAPLSTGSYVISPDSSRVVYLEQQGPGVQELFSVPIGGGPIVRLNAMLTTGGSVTAFQISADGARVIYRADQDTDQRFELYSVPIAGGTATKLNDPLDPDTDVSDQFTITADGSAVVFEVYDPNADAHRHFSVPIGGGTVVTLNPAPSGGAVWGGGHHLSPDSARVLFFQFSLAGEVDLYSTPIGGGSVVRLNSTLVTGGTVSIVRISADSARVVYQADQDEQFVHELYSVPIEGGTVVKLNPNLSSCCSTGQFDISPDASRVLYLANQENAEKVELFSVPIEGGPAIKLNHSLIGTDDVLDFQLTDDGQWVVYRAFVSAFGINEPYGYRAPIAGPADSGEVIWSNVSNGIYRITPNQRSVVVLGEGRSGLTPPDGVRRLWVANLAGPPAPTAPEVVPSAVLEPDGDIGSFVLGAGGEVFYISDQDVDEQSELYRVLIEIFSDGFESPN